jgi:transcriptional regulator with XRE-family HTH domain
MDDWRGALLEARKRLGIGRGKLAEMAGVSAETLRGYEIGRRHPKHDTLEAVIGALRLERVQANSIREGAGFAPVRSLFAGERDYCYSVEDLQDTVEEAEWPEFVTNDSYELVAVNTAACALWRVESFAVRRAAAAD